MPNLDKLSPRSLHMTATSACPADIGGMVSLLTGLHPRQHGYLNQAQPTEDRDQLANGVGSVPGKQTVAQEGWPNLFSQAGYYVAAVGCVDLLAPGLDQTVLVANPSTIKPKQCAYLLAMQDKSMRPAIEQQRRQRLRYGLFEPDRLLMEPDEDIDGFIAVQARKTLAHMPTDKPWVLIVVFSGPGNDLPPPTLYDYVVDPAGLTHGFTPADFRHLNAMAELDYPRVLLQRLEPHRIGRIRADYLGRASLIDHGIGRFLSQIDDRPDRDHTWSVISSDRGYLLGENGLVGHRSFLAGAVNVPVIITPPTPPAKCTATDLVSTADVGATIAALGGCDLSAAARGRSLLPILADQPIDTSINHIGSISEFGHRLMLKTTRYKVVFDTDRYAAISLYNIADDPDELNNLIKHPSSRNVLDSMRWRLGDVLLPLRAVPRGNGSTQSHPPPQDKGG